MVKLDRGHLLLLDWGQWRVRGVSGLGYPSTTTIGRVMHDGLGMSETFGPRVPLYDGDVMLSRLDQWLRALPAESRLLTVAWCQYVGKDGYGMRGDRRFLAAGLSERTYFRVLSDLRGKVKGWRSDYLDVYADLDEREKVC